MFNFPWGMASFALILSALTKGGLSIFTVAEGIGVNMITFVGGTFLRLVSSKVSKHCAFIDNMKMKYLFLFDLFYLRSC